jgi:nucleoporin NDC1
MSASPRTLIRATPSLTASRGASSVPACAETYEPLVKAALRTRLQRDVLLPTALFSWASASMWRGWNSSGGIFRALTVPFMPVTLVLALLTWFAAALPIIILRKQHLQASRVVNASPKSTFDAVIKRPGTVKASLVYTASAAASLLLHYVVAYATETHDPKIGVFGRSK